MMDLVRVLAPQVLGVLVRRYGDFAGAEDAVQEALIAAAEAWPRDGLPDNPRAWLLRVASRRMIDQIRAENARREREAVALESVAEDSSERDDTLQLLFMCCHPTLSPASAIALTLRAVGGLTTLEIAKAFLVPEATLAQRISRAKQTIAQSGLPFTPPTAAEAAARLGAVLHVLYLIFSEGYTASAGSQLQRTDLSNEALRLTRMLLRATPADSEVEGLLALMLLTDARRAARSDDHGALIPLDEQDRSLWDRRAIAEGVELVQRALARGAVGPYQVQAAIAALHDEAASTDTTDWPQILGLYGLLRRMADNPIVALNQVVALAMVQGPAAGLASLDALAADPRLRDHHRFEAVRAHLLERAGELERAAEHYRRAAERTSSVPEQNYLTLRAARLSHATSKRTSKS